MKETSNLYFIAIIPPGSVSDELTSFKEDFAKRFNSRKALKIIPHITLKIPFRLESKEHAALLTWFANLELNVPPFTLYLDGFGSFMRRGQPIIFVTPVNANVLITFQEDLIDKMEQDYPACVEKDDRAFTPHMTIAYRDLDRNMFKQAWKDYKNKIYRAEFEVEHISLLMHDSRVWKVIAKCRLDSQNAQ